MATTCPKCQSDNSDTARFCTNCGSPLHPPKDIHAPKALEKPITELSTGSTFAGRYQIIEELGKGGMGNVYRAVDKMLNEEVALKLIKPEIASDETTLERFRNELKLARKITHKNVGRMYDLMEEKGTHYITMEYVSGQDLKGLIRQSKQLTVKTTINIAKKICEGLSEAHRLGVVHRDLKPSNIMIDKEGNARIMDFGIARSFPEEGIKDAGVMIGTPEYMSPEQIQNRGVDQRSDIYSLGVILYETVTGQVPFNGNTPLAISLKHLQDAPRDPRDLNPQIPEDLNRLILKCLEKEKEDRYQSAEDLCSELVKIEEAIRDTEKVPKVPRALAKKKMTRHFGLPMFFFPALVLVLAVALLLVIWSPWSQEEAAPTPTDKPSLAILYFKNNTGDTALDHWSMALSDLLITDLSQSQYLRVLSGEALFDILSQLDQQDAQVYSSDVLREVARRGQIENVLVGNYTKAGDRFRINVTLQQASTGELIGSERVEGTGERSFYSMVDELTRRIKANFRIPDEMIAADIDEQVGIITTSSPEALRYYTEGVESTRQAQYNEALESLQMAVDIDPDFAMGYEAISTVYNNLGYSSEEREYLKKAFELADRVSERELYQIQGAYYRTTETTFDKAIEAYNRLLALYPEDGDANNRLGLIYKSIEEWDEAIERFEVCVQRKYDRFFYYVNVAETYMAKGMYERAGEILELYIDQFPGLAWVHGDYAINHLCQRQHELAHAEADKALSLDPTHFHALWIKGDIYHSQGVFPQAEAEYRKLLGEDEEVARLYGWDSLGDLHLSQGRIDDAIAQATQGLRLAESVGDTAWISWLSSRLCYMLMRTGNYLEALIVSSKAVQSDVGEVRLDLQRRALYLEGLIQVAMNALTEARSTAEELRGLIEGGLNKKEIRLYHHLIGMIELARDNFPEAIEYFNQAISFLPYQYYRHPWIVGNDQALFLDSLALAYYRLGDFDKAQDEYEKIQALTVGRLDYGDIFAKSFYSLGKIFEQKGWKAQAIGQYENFLELWKNADPGLPEVEDARKRLGELKRNQAS